MIQIIKRGTRKTCTCKDCGCVFSYESEDVKIGGGYPYVICPQCNTQMYAIKEIHNKGNEEK